MKPATELVEPRSPDPTVAKDELVEDSSSSIGAPTRWNGKVMLGIIFFALLLRLICVARCEMIGADSARFLAVAERFERNDSHLALQDDYHPLTAFLTAQVNGVQNLLLPPLDGLRETQARRERAGHIVLITAGLFVVLLLMGLTARLFPLVPPAAVGLLAAIQPYFVRSSADIMSDTLFLAFFLLALHQATVTFQTGRWFPAVTAGIAVGLSYLTRPEGLVLIPAISIIWLKVNYRRPRLFMSRLALFGVASALLILPYMASNGWELTRKKSLVPIFNLKNLFHSLQQLFDRKVGSLEPTANVAYAGLGSWIDPTPILRIVERWFKAGPEILALAALIGLWVTFRRRQWGMGHFVVGVVCGLMAMVLLGLIAHVGDPGYLSTRHVFTLVALSLPIAGHGLFALGALVAPILPGGLSRHSGYLMVFAALAVMAPKAIDVQRENQVAQRQAAEFILEHGGEGQSVHTPREKIAYYSGGVWKGLNPNLTLAIGDLLAESRAWLAYYRDEMEPGTRNKTYAHFHELVQETVGSTALRHMTTFHEANAAPPRHLEVYLWEKPAQ